ncbi:MAG: HU family DNA-binding protein [Candidatus Falkowbacteria bacterium]|nr:HU family DNA-binding protein [Candidatus Falkowbacteria bacterium]
MNKAALIEKISDETHIAKRQVEEVVDKMVDIIVNQLKNGSKVSLVGFGAFEARTRHTRGGVNPQKPNERIQIPEVKVAKFKTGKTLKDALKGKF